jgi:hypothetical protein
MDVYEAVTSRRAVRGFAVRGFKDGELRPYGPRPARRDGHVRRWLVTCARRQEAIGQSDIGLFFC